MDAKLADYIAQGKMLSTDEREIAAIELQQVDDVAQAEIDAERDKEIDCRIDEVLSGKVELVDGEETRRMVGEILAARRASRERQSDTR